MAGPRAKRAKLYVAEESTDTLVFDAPTPVPTGGSGCLTVTRGAALGTTYKIETTLVLGRGNDSDVDLSEDGISRRHCRLWRADDATFLIQDLQSRNGTWVNGQRIDKAKLKDGDQIQVGRSTCLRFNLQDDAHRYLREARLMQTVGSLAGGIAHEFNNLLAVVLSGVSVLKQTEQDPLPPEDMQRCLQDMEEATLTARELTTQLLGFARRGKFAPRSLDLSSLLHGTSRLMQQTFDRLIDIHVNIAPDLMILADEGQLRQVLLDLCTNARDAMPHGGDLGLGAETCELGQNEATLIHPSLLAGNYVRIDVSDTGVGLSAAEAQRVFEPFFSTKNSGGGLGLATAYGIVRRHGGSICVDSKLDQGTTFRIYLPQVRPQATLDPRSTARTTRAIPTQNQRADSSLVLVVDDEAPVRRGVRRILKRLGYQIIEAGDGVEAMEIFEERHGEIQLVLLDLVMPRMAGAETFAEMRKIAPRMPVLLCSGYDDGQATEILGANDVDFLAKPFTVSHLKEALERLVAAPTPRL